MIISAVWLGGMGAVRADDGVVDKSSDARQSLEIRRRFAELSRKVNELPELQALKADVEKAQAAYAEAFEVALAKEDPEILKQYRALFEARMERLQGKKIQVDAASAVSAAKGGQNAAEVKQIAEVQQKAMLSPAVREALQKWSSATNDEERTAAETAYAEILRKTMIEIDPALSAALSEGAVVTTPAPTTEKQSGTQPAK